MSAFCKSISMRHLLLLLLRFPYNAYALFRFQPCSRKAPSPLSRSLSLSEVKAKLSNKFGYCHLYTVSIFCKLINTTAYYLGRYEPSSPVSCHAPRCSTSFIQSLNHTFTLTLSLSLSSTVSRGLSPSLVGFLFPLTLTTNNRISSLLEFTTLRHSLVHIPIWAPLSLSLTPTSLSPSVGRSLSCRGRRRSGWACARRLTNEAMGKNRDRFLLSSCSSFFILHSLHCLTFKNNKK